MKTFPIHSEDGVMLLDMSSLRPIAFDRGAAALLSDPDSTHSSNDWESLVPDEIVKAIRNTKPSELSTLKTHFRVGKDKYLCRTYLMEYPEGGATQSIVALHLHRSSSSGEAVDELAAEYDLTHREQEALLGISRGLTCKEVAELMKISPNTVKAYLRLIMVKMGVTRRAGIMGKLLEHTANVSNGGYSNSFTSAHSSLKHSSSTARNGSAHR